MFEKIDDATALLMPGNLLASDSVRAKMLALDPANFDEIEVVGWLYQFYISEQKDKLMEAGKAYKKEEIPAVTQLFTPNWIVKYMIQNSLGSKWLETYPNSPLKSKMEYYIEPAKQDPEVQKELDKIKDERINPEELKVLDPACGSGHILVEAYDLLKEIYTERGYPTYSMSKQSRRMMDAWNVLYPVTPWECTRAKRIEEIQGNPNPFVKEPCIEQGLYR